MHATRDAVGAALEYVHRPASWASAYARAEAYRDFERGRWDYLALAGLRMRW